MSRTDDPRRTAPSEIAGNPDRWTEVGELLAFLYRIVDLLEVLFPGRKFTPDGHLVGSIGEVIAARMIGCLPAQRSTGPCQSENEPSTAPTCLVTDTSAASRPTVSVLDRDAVLAAGHPAARRGEWGIATVLTS